MLLNMEKKHSSYKDPRFQRFSSCEEFLYFRRVKQRLVYPYKLIHRAIDNARVTDRSDVHKMDMTILAFPIHVTHVYNIYGLT